MAEEVAPELEPDVAVSDDVADAVVLLQAPNRARAIATVNVSTINLVFFILLLLNNVLETSNTLTTFTF